MPLILARDFRQQVGAPFGGLSIGQAPTHGQAQGPGTGAEIRDRRKYQGLAQRSDPNPGTEQCRRGEAQAGRHRMGMHGARLALLLALLVVTASQGHAHCWINGCAPGLCCG